jgi:hypothetical protein
MKYLPDWRRGYVKASRHSCLALLDLEYHLLYCGSLLSIKLSLWGVYVNRTGRIALLALWGP